MITESSVNYFSKMFLQTNISQFFIFLLFDNLILVNTCLK